jgi:predicted protein tyrosine phosphatase
MSKELIKTAIALGIENVEALTAPKLKIAVKAAQSKLDAFKALILKAESFGIETKDVSEADLLLAVTEAEDIAEQIVFHARQAEMLAFLSEYLGITDIDSLSKDEVQDLLVKRETVTASEISVVVEQEGKTDKSFEASNGKEYVFADDAPTAFRYLGQHRTQEEWIADGTAIELMVAGRLSFLTLKK